jgi:hypothetical protein
MEDIVMFYGHLVYFTAIWYNCMVIWYIFGTTKIRRSVNSSTEAPTSYYPKNKCLTYANRPHLVLPHQPATGVKE